MDKNKAMLEIENNNHKLYKFIQETNLTGDERDKLQSIFDRMENILIGLTN